MIFTLQWCRVTGFHFFLEEMPSAGNESNDKGSDAIQQRICGVLSDKSPHFTLLMKPGNHLRMGSNGRGCGPMLQMHVSADALADFYIELKREYALRREQPIFEVNNEPLGERPQQN